MSLRRKVSQVYGFPTILFDRPQHFCPGCSHGIMARVIAEVIGEMGLGERAIGVYGPGCSVLFHDYIDVRGVAAAPGAAVAAASGLKQALPGELVFVYVGEGDLASGLSQLFSAGMRGERLTVICENNFTMGMSGGSASLTTPLGTRTTTTPKGRRAEKDGFPFRIAESLASLRGITLAARAATHSPGMVRRAKRMVQTAFEHQLFGTGMGFLEVLGMCPTNLNLPPRETSVRVREISEGLTLGVLKGP